MSQSEEPKDCIIRVLVKRPIYGFGDVEENLVYDAGRESLLSELEFIGCAMVQFEDKDTVSPAYYFNKAGNSLLVLNAIVSSTAMAVGLSLRYPDLKFFAIPVALANLLSVPDFGTVCENSSNPRYHDKIEIPVTRSVMKAVERDIKKPDAFYSFLFNSCAHFALKRLNENGIDIPKPIIKFPQTLSTALNRAREEEHQHTYGESIFSRGRLQLLFAKNERDPDKPVITTFTDRLVDEWRSSTPSQMYL